MKGKKAGEKNKREKKRRKKSISFLRFFIVVRSNIKKEKTKNAPRKGGERNHFEKESRFEFVVV